MAKRSELHHPQMWKQTKYVSWPASWQNPMVRIPLPSGKYITRSVIPENDELTTLSKCKQKRDAIAIPIWGEEAWHRILSVPSRSTTKPRKNPKTPYNGVMLIERPGRAPHYIVSWYELNISDECFVESQTHGKRLPRRLKTKAFSYGTERAKFSRQEEALKEAIDWAKKMQSKNYSVIHSRDKNAPPIIPIRT